MTVRGDAGSADRGETLIELLVTVVIMGIAVLTLLGGVGTGLRMSAIHREQASAGAYVRNFGEAIEGVIEASPSGYVDCADTSTYSAAFTLADPLFSSSITDVQYWNGSGFTNSCVLGSDQGVQRISLTVDSTDNLASEQMDVIVRRPCRLLSVYPLDPPCS